MKTLRGFVQSSIVLLDKIPSNLVLRDIVSARLGSLTLVATSRGRSRSRVWRKGLGIGMLEVAPIIVERDDWVMRSHGR